MYVLYYLLKLYGHSLHNMITCAECVHEGACSHACELFTYLLDKIFHELRARTTISIANVAFTVVLTFRCIVVFLFLLLFLWGLPIYHSWHLSLAATHIQLVGSLYYKLYQKTTRPICVIKDNRRYVFLLITSENINC
ncbi:hypothetical protein BRADI_2g26122v3 [Brachypodium distachyon]|uniref:Uncharacterized protein n=1 Tax=Brachypodium distachyon TaxID=15368 RepID=A0A2K2DAK1_BRADI|nr:hypothetical protein BRADI_2g26122v3 [Brachypodium distachyon]